MCEVHELQLDDDWEEAVLWNDERETLLVPRRLGHCQRSGLKTTMGVRPTVEQSLHELAEWDPEHILVGHGTSIHTGAQFDSLET